MLKGGNVHADTGLNGSLPDIFNQLPDLQIILLNDNPGAFASEVLTNEWIPAFGIFVHAFPVYFGGIHLVPFINGPH